MKVFKIIVKRMIQYYDEDNIPAYAAQVSFFIIISAIPLIMLFVSLLQYILPEQNMIIEEALSAIVPEASGLRSFVMEILDEIYTNSTGAIVSVSLIVTLWSASKGIFCMQEGLNNLRHFRAGEGYVRRRAKAILYTVAFVLILLFLVVFVMGGEFLRDLLTAVFPGMKHLSLLITLLRSVIAFVLFLHFFVLVYASLPSGKKYYTNTIPSAVFTTVGWMMFSYLYAFYLNHIATNSYIYGSLTALILLMLWLYFCMIIFFLGAELNKLIITRSKNRKFTIRISVDVLREAYGEEYVKEKGLEKFEALEKPQD